MKKIFYLILSAFLLSTNAEASSRGDSLGGFVFGTKPPPTCLYVDPLDKSICAISGTLAGVSGIFYLRICLGYITNIVFYSNLKISQSDLNAIRLLLVKKGWRETELDSYKSYIYSFENRLRALKINNDGTIQLIESLFELCDEGL